MTTKKLLFSLCVTLLMSLSSYGALTLQLSSTTITIGAGNTGTISGTVTNTTGAALNGSDLFFNFGGFDPAVIININQLLGNPDFPFPNNSMTGTIPLFEVTIDPAALAGGYTLDAFLQDINNVTSNTETLTITVGGQGPTFLQNSVPVSVPTNADYVVNGKVSTGTPTEDNTVNSLLFQSGSSLQIFNTLTLTSGFVVTAGSSSISGGTLSGPNGLTFNVNGVMTVTSTLQGNLIKTGSGNLLLNGTLNGSAQVQAGLLGGNANITGDLVNKGTVSPGNSPGTFHVGGSYRQSSNGTLRIEIGGRKRGQYDRLIVSGQADLNGRLDLVRLSGFDLKRGDKITFLTAGHGVNGEFSSISNPFESNTILLPSVVYDDHKVSLEMVRGSFVKYADDWGLTLNQRATARGLDTVSHDKPDNKALVYLDKRNLSKLPGDFDRIAPEELTSIATTSVSMSTAQGNNLQRRADDIRSGANGFSAAGLAVNGQAPSFSGNIGFRTGSAGPSGNDIRDGKESKEIKSTVDEEKRWGTFLTGTGEWVDVSGDGNARGYDLSTGGFTLGLDYKVAPNFAIGIAAGYAGTSADLTRDGRVWVNGGKLGIYGTFFQSSLPTPAPTMSKDASKDSNDVMPADVTGSFYADFGVFGGYNSYDTKRSALQGAARGSTDGGELNVLFGVGYDWKIGALTIGPTATFNYTLVGMDGFTEHGSLAPLAIDDQTTESIRTTVGFRANCEWQIGSFIFKPELRASWHHEYGDTAYDLTSSFGGGAGNAFTVRGPEIGRDSLLLGAGFAIQLSDTCTTYFYYDGELAREGYDRHSVSGGMRLAF